MKKTKHKYRVFYHTIVQWDGKITEEKEEPLGTTYAVSEAKAINNIRYKYPAARGKIPYYDTCENEGQGYSRSSLIKAERIDE